MTAPDSSGSRSLIHPTSQESTVMRQHARNRTADDRPRDRKRTSRAKSTTLRRKAERRAKAARQGR
jgi:hypothetical protein